MASQGSGYDQSASTFSPDGRLFQIEYAGKAVKAGGTAIGMRCADGVVLGVEKVIFSRMLVPGSNRKIFSVDRHAGMATAGLGPDGRQLVNTAREQCEQYRDVYGHAMLPDVLANRMSVYMHYFTLHGGLRPFGCSALIASYDKDTQNHALHMIEPSGVCFRYFGCATGKGAQNAKTELEKLRLSELSCRDAIVAMAKIMHTIRDARKDKPFELEMSWLCAESNWQHQHVPADLILAAEEQAKAEIVADEREHTGEDTGAPDAAAAAGGADGTGQASMETE